jgi:hypothetical protein
MAPQVPIDTLPLFPALDELLLTFLKKLSAEEWERQTLAPRWKVMDVALHLLDGNLRTLSMLRDGYFGVQPPAEAATYRGLVDFLNQLNADWITATRRLSPAVVLWLLELTGREYTALLQTLDPWAPALFAVAWAGEEQSTNWFHIAREYTEKWHHQQQIRVAVGRGEEALLTPGLYTPYLRTSMYALPHHFRDVEASTGTTVRVAVTGNAPGEWFLERNAERWELRETAKNSPVTSIEIGGELAWRLLSRELPRTETERCISITGEPRFGEKLFDLVAVMA